MTKSDLYGFEWLIDILLEIHLARAGGGGGAVQGIRIKLNPIYGARELVNLRCVYGI